MADEVAEPSEPAEPAGTTVDPDAAAREHALDVLSVIESVLENPGVILAAQVDRLRSSWWPGSRWRASSTRSGWNVWPRWSRPKPLREFLYGTFDVFRRHHPWVGDENVKPKSVARELYETGFDFRQYIEHHGLKRSEGIVLRYLSEAYKALVQNVPEGSKTEALYDLEAWLGETVRQIDSSLLDEWEKFRNPDEVPADGDGPSAEPGTGAARRDPQRPGLPGDGP